jgi:HAD superfamily hydrolase (TIGR01549 family)
VELTKMLQAEGYEEEAARTIVEDNYQLDNTINDDTLKQITDVKTLFKILKNNDIKVAVCTSDSRTGTMETLSTLGLSEYVDHVVCGDDPDTKPKPAPHNAWQICEQLDVDPATAAMVGDTSADVGMGKVRASAIVGKVWGMIWAIVCMGMGMGKVWAWAIVGMGKVWIWGAWARYGQRFIVIWRG